MSDTTPLTDLANFVAKSPLVSQDEFEHRVAVNAVVDNLSPRPAHQKVTDLLGIVMALSARTRRMVQSPVEVDLDVFSPNNTRAVKLRIGQPQ